MSVHDLIESLARAGENGEPLDFRAIREQIYEEHDKASSIEDRVRLLKVFNLVMDLVEKFRERQHKIRAYSRFS
jgi:hypothetical protein